MKDFLERFVNAREPDVQAGDVWENGGKRFKVSRVEGYHCVLKSSGTRHRAFTPLVHEGNGWRLLYRSADAVPSSPRPSSSDSSLFYEESTA